MALALDAAAANSGGGNAVSGNVTLSTSVLHDVIVLCVFNKSGSHNGNNPIAISGVSDTAGLTWTKRSSKTFGKGAVNLVRDRVGDAFERHDHLQFCQHDRRLVVHGFCGLRRRHLLTLGYQRRAAGDKRWIGRRAEHFGLDHGPQRLCVRLRRIGKLFLFFHSAGAADGRHRAFQHGVGPGIRVEPCGIRHQVVAAIKPLADLQFNKRRLGDARRRHR